VPAALLWGGLAVAGVLGLWRRAPLAVALLVAPVVVTAVAIVALGQPMRPRFFFFVSGTAAIFGGHGLGLLAAWLARRGQSGPSAPARGRAAAWLVLATMATVALSVPALPRNYAWPKQDFDRAVRFAEIEEARGARVAVAGPACLPLDRYYGKVDWPCLASIADLQRLAASGAPVLIVHTLGVYIEDAPLRERVLEACPEVARFPGTLGGGDLIVCAPGAPEGGA
jgi:hypothetical protein